MYWPSLEILSSSSAIRKTINSEQFSVAPEFDTNGWYGQSEPVTFCCILDATDVWIERH